MNSHQISKILQSSSISILRDFIEVKNLQQSNLHTLEQFIVLAVKKYIDVFLSNSEDIIANYKIHLPMYLKVGISKAKIPIQEIITKTNLYQKGKITIEKNIIYFIKNKNTLDENFRIVFSPLDGIEHFARGVAFFSHSFSFQEINEENKYVSLFSLVYDPLMQELFHADKITSFCNKIKIINNKNRKIEHSTLISDINFKDSNIGNFVNNLVLFNSHSNFSNSNLALSYIAAGRFDSYISNNIEDEGLILAGMHIASKSGLQNKVSFNKENQKFYIITQAL